MKRCLFLIAYTLLSFAGSSHSAESIYPTQQSRHLCDIRKRAISSNRSRTDGRRQT